MRQSFPRVQPHAFLLAYGTKSGAWDMLRVLASGRGAGEELKCPPLERGGRRRRLLLAGELRHERRRQRSPAGELGLERCHGGDSLQRGTDPQEVGFCLVLDRGVKCLGEKCLEVG